MNWRTLNSKIGLMTEDDLLKEIDNETNAAASAAILKRLHQRYCALRAERERTIILSKAKKV